MTIHLFRSVSVVTHKLIELNKICMAAILKALSTVVNEKRKKQKVHRDKTTENAEYSKDTSH